MATEQCAACGEQVKSPYPFNNRLVGTGCTENNGGAHRLERMRDTAVYLAGLMAVHAATHGASRRDAFLHAVSTHKLTWNESIALSLGLVARGDFLLHDVQL